MLEKDILSFIKKYSHTSAPDAEFNDLALRIFAYQFKKNANYRKFCEIEGSSPNSVKNWKNIPAMPAQGFKELVLASFPAKKAKRIFRTSGTTAMERRGAHFFETLRLYDAAILPPFREHVLAGEKNFSFYFLMHSPQSAKDSSLSHMMGVVNSEFSAGRGRFYVKKGQILGEALVRDLKREKKKVLLLATAFSLKAFLNELASKKIVLRLPEGSRLMETGGFKGRTREVTKHALYRECQKRLGIRSFVSEYGMTELSSQFYCVYPGRTFKAPAWIRSVVMEGVLRHVDLANLGSVIAVQTEDRGRVAKDGFEFLGRASTAELRGCSLAYEEFIRS